MRDANQGSVILNVATRHRLAGTTLADLLQRELKLRAHWYNPTSETPSAPVVVLLTHFEPTETLPRLLSNLQTENARVLFVYDGTRPHDDLIELANAFRVWSAYDLHDDMRVLLDQVRSAHAGRAWSQDLFAKSLSGLLTKSQHRLSPRETEVAHAFCGAEALNPDDIAQRLNLSPNTVRTHLANIRRKLGDRYTGNRDALRSALVDRGWLD